MRFVWSASGWHRRRSAIAEKSRLHRRANRWKRILLRREWQNLPMVFVFYGPAFRRVWNCLMVCRCEYLFTAHAGKSWWLPGHGELPESGGRTPGIRRNGMWKFVFHRAHKKINALQMRCQIPLGNADFISFITIYGSSGGF